MSGGPPPHMFPGMPGHPQGPPQPFWGQQPQQPPPTSLSPGQNLLQLLHSQLPPPQPSPYHSFPSGPGGAPGPYPPYGYQGPPQGYPPQQSPQQFIPPMPSSIPIPKMSVPSAAPPAAASPTSPSTSSFTGFPLTSSSPSFAPPSQLIENPLPISEIANYPREWDVNVHQLIAVNHHYICYALKNGLLRVISQTTGKNVLLKGHTNNAPILDMSLSPHSSSHLFTLTSQQFIIWSLQQTDDSITYTMILCVDGIYNHGCWHPTKPDVVAVVEGKRVQIWDIQQALRTVKPSTTITSSHLTAHLTLFTSTPSHPSPITSLSYSHDGSILATSSQDGLLQLIDSNNHIIRAWYPHNQHVINRVMFLSSGNYTLNDYVLITTAQTGDATTTHRDIKIWASQGKDWLCVHTLKLEKGINDIIYNQVQIDPSGSFMVVSYKTIDPVGRADDYGFFVFHIRRPQHPSTSTWDLIATRFDYVTPYNVPYPLVSFLLLNTTHEWCNDDIHTINNLSIYGVHTKPIQQMILKSHECWKMVLPSAIQPSIVVSSVAVTTDEGKEEKVEDEDEDSDEGEAELGPDSEIYPLKTVDDIEIKDPITGIITTIGERRRSSASGEYPTAMEVGEITTAEIDDNLLHINQSRPTRRSVIEETPTTSTQMESLMDKLVRHANQEVKDENDSVGEMTTQPQPSITITDGLSKRGSVVAIMETNAVLNRESTYVPLKIHDEDEDEEEDRLGMLAGDDSPLSGPSPAASSDRRPPRTRPNSISLSASQYSGPNVPPSPSFLSQQAAVQATQPPGILYGESDTPSSSPAPSPSMSSSLYINTSAEASHVPPTPASTPTGLSLYARPPRKISTSSALPLPPVGEATVNDFANVPTPSPSLHISTLSPATNTPNPTPRQSIGPTVTTPLLQPSTSSSMIIPPDLSMPVESPSSTLKISTDTRTYQPTPTPASTPTALTAYQTFQRPTTPDMSPASGLPPKARGRVQSISEKKGEYERGILKGAIVKEEDKDEENGDGDGKKKSKSAQETALITRLDKLFARHFAKLVITLENERENEERIQKLVTAMTQVINSQLPQHVETAIKSEVQKNMLPAVGRWLTQLLQKLTTTVLQPALEKTLSQSVTSTLTDPSSLIESLSTSIATSLRQPIQDSFRSSFSTVLLPAFEASTRTMFKQITDTFHAMTEQNKKLLEQQMNVKPVDIKQTNEYKQWEKEKEKARQAHEREMSELRTLRESLASQTSQTSTSTLLAEIRTLTTTVASLMTTNQAMSRQLKEMAQQQQIQGQLIATISEHNSRHTSGSTSPTTSSSSSITNKEIDPKLEITSLLASKQFDTAFIRALSAGSPSLVVWTCSQLDPHVLLRTTIPSHRLSSPVQLSLIQQLGFALNTDTALKLSWLRELCHAMDATDGLIRAHVAPIVKEVLHHFDTQMKDITDDYNNPLYDKALNVKRGLGDLLKMATP